MSLQIKLLSPNGTLPTRGSDGSAGYDLYSAEDVLVVTKALVATDIAMKVPGGTYGRIAPRSSLANKMIDVGGGVIDSDYTGHCKVILYNFSDNPFVIKKGDRIAQLILEKISYAPIEQVADLVPTERGCGGFGSTGQ